jgi:hypothetical protein
MTGGSVAAHGYHPWITSLWASEEARRRGDRRAGTDHLLLGLLEGPSIEALLGVRLPDARAALAALDREALGSRGLGPAIDAPPLPMHPVPVTPTFRAVMKDRLRMSPAVKRTLQEAGRPMRRGKRIRPEEVLVRILEREPPDPAAVLLAALGVDRAAVRLRLDSDTPTT